VWGGPLSTASQARRLVSLVGPRWRREGEGFCALLFNSWRSRFVAVVVAATVVDDEVEVVGGGVVLVGVALEEEWDFGMVVMRYRAKERESDLEEVV
jgi:hypothetical protein